VENLNKTQSLHRFKISYTLDLLLTILYFTIRKCICTKLRT